VQPVRNDGLIDYRYDRIGNMLAQTSSPSRITSKRACPSRTSATWTRWRHSAVGTAPDVPQRRSRPPRFNSPPFANRNSPFAAFPYDPNGNMTDIDGLICTWDFKDRLIGVENSEMRAEYTYDYTDRRITKRVGYKAGAPWPSTLPRITPPRTDDSSVSYPNKYFEVREHDAPTKYVWNGNTRVARVTGSLNTNVRVQRLRVFPGWNLCSLAVSSPSPFWGEGRGQVLSATFRWNPVTLGWDEVLSSDSLPAGTVLWIQATTNVNLTITGTYADPTNRTVNASGDFLPSAGLEAWNILSAISNQPSTTLWTYGAQFTPLAFLAASTARTPV
jgi:hypothetical protein